MKTTFNHSDGAFFENDGASLYYEEAGTAEAPALIFLHGGMGHLETFNSITPKFAPHFRIIGLDSRGHGRSGLGEKGLRYEFLQNDVEALVKHLGLGSFSILGFSDGGLVGYRLAAFTELPIEKIVAVGAPWRVEQERFLKENRAKITGDAMRERQPDYF
ncbi:alpha/beta hydrolase [bacterium]|nr:MAG: alpha/beta hydrolase [bacterium]